MGHAVGHPRVLAQKDPDLGSLEITAGHPTEHLPRHPEFPGLLLSQRVGAVADPKGRLGGARVGARRVISLPTTAVVEDALPAMCVLHGVQTLADFPDRRVPGNFLEAPVVAAAQRMKDAIRRLQIVVQTVGFLAGVALGAGVGLVPANAREAPILFAQLDFESAVALTQIAGGGDPGLGASVGGHRLPPVRVSRANEITRPPGSASGRRVKTQLKLGAG